VPRVSIDAKVPDRRHCGKLGCVDRNGVAAWIGDYERVWRTPGTDTLAEIFTDDAYYLQGPYREPMVGLPQIARMWEAERDGPDEVFRMSSEVVAVDGDTAVARAQVWYGEPVTDEWRDLWIMRFESDGRCRYFEEWPIPPSR
jgi:ketosteroid isomerase-like protein